MNWAVTKDNVRKSKANGSFLYLESASTELASMYNVIKNKQYPKHTKTMATDITTVYELPGTSWIF
jgi:hypothetical protein